MNIQAAAFTFLAFSAAIAATTASAQQARACPQLPATANLHWEQIQNPDLLFCKAVDTAGGQPFSLMVSRESPFSPIRRLRAETTTVNGGETLWYRTEIAARPDIVARETAVTLADGSVAYFNVQVSDESGLQRIYSQIAALDF